MYVILVSILVIVTLAAVFWIVRSFYVKRLLKKRVIQKYKSVESLIQKLDSNEPIAEAEMDIMMKNPSIRYAVFWILDEFKRGDLFPVEYNTYEKGAESVLVNWLEFPTELGIAPSQIEFLERIMIEDKEPHDYYVFRYKTEPPHWAAKWMIGVSGPYLKESTAYYVPLRVYSRFLEAETTTALAEATWVHHNVGKK